MTRAGGGGGFVAGNGQGYTSRLTGILVYEEGGTGGQDTLALFMHMLQEHLRLHQQDQVAEAALVAHLTQTE